MSGGTITSYKDLIVWKKSMDLVVAIYQLTETFPKHEQYGIISQMRRCVVSIPSNVAEGCHRGSRQDYRRFLLIAYGSGSELETQLEISKRLSYANNEQFMPLSHILDEVMRMLNKMISALV